MNSDVAHMATPLSDDLTIFWHFLSVAVLGLRSGVGRPFAFSGCRCAGALPPYDARDILGHQRQSEKENRGKFQQWKGKNCGIVKHHMRKGQVIKYED